MSLLNQMLRDLDQRDAPAMDRASLSSHVRVLPARHQPSRHRDVGLLLAGIAAGTAIAWGVLHLRDETPPPRAPSAVPAPVVPRAATPAPASAVPPVPEIPGAPPSPPSPPLASIHPAPVPSSAVPKGPVTVPPLRMDADLASPPRAPVVPEAAAKRLPPSPMPAPRKATPPASDPAPVETATPQIDKTSRVPKVSEVADSEYRKAMAAVRRGALSEGAEGLRGALQLDSRHAQARQALLSVLVEQKQWREALRVATEGLALDPTQSGWAMVGARLLVEQGDLPRAAELLATHDAHGQRNADYQAFHGLLMHKLQRPKEAARYYHQSAVSLRPAEGRWWYGLGLAYEADQRDAEAKDAYRRARDSGTLPPDLVPLIEQKLR